MTSSHEISGLAGGVALHHRAVSLVRGLRNVELELARVLGAMERSGEFRRYASSITDYARFIGLGRGKGRQLAVIGRALPVLPKLHDVMRDGSLAWTAAFEVARVAVPETEAGWIAVAEQWPVRELRCAVAAACKGDPAPAVSQRPEVDLTTLRFELAPEDAQLVRRAMTLLRSQAAADNQDDQRVHLSEEEVLVQMARIVVGSEAPAAEVSSARFTTVIRECPACGEAELAGLADGERAPVSEATREMARCDAVEVSVAAGEMGRAHATVSPRVRRAVMERDNYRCAVPGCSNAMHLDIHHVVHREHGGSNALSNLVCLCSGCHRRAHLGFLCIEHGARGELCFAWTPEGSGARAG